MPNKVLEISILSWGSFMAQKKSGLRNVNLFCCRKMNYYNMIGGVIFWMCGQVSELFSPTECPRRQRMIFFAKKHGSQNILYLMQQLRYLLGNYRGSNINVQ